MTLLSPRNLSVDYRTATRIVHAVRDVGFDVAAGERGVVGAPGPGKTTKALALMQMIEPPGRIVTGSADLNGTDLLALTGDAVRRARLDRVACIPQGAINSLNPVLRIGAQILDGLARALARMFPHELSGGIKQRACIAISLALEPELIAAQERTGCGLMLIGHDVGLMAQATHRVIVMQDGHIAEDAPVRRIFAAPSHSDSKMLIDSAPFLDRAATPPRWRRRNPGRRCWSFRTCHACSAGGCSRAPRSWRCTAVRDRAAPGPHRRGRAAHPGDRGAPSPLYPLVAGASRR